MEIVYVYNDQSNLVEKYEKDLGDAMPYVEGRTLTVREFKGASCSPVLWTDRRALVAWNKTRLAYGAPIPLWYAFKRIWEGGHTGSSQHYAGVAFDVGQTLTAAQRQKIYNTAVATGAWGYVEPLSMTPGWVHMDRRTGVPACAVGGYPAIRQGSKGVYVFVMQDALNALGFTGGGLDGIFGPKMADAVRRFQQTVGLAPDGVVGCATWQAIVQRVLDIGQTPTVVGKCV